MDEIVARNVFYRMGWLFASVAVHDPAPSHAILGYAMAHIANLHGKAEPIDAADHKVKAIQLVNQRILDPSEALSDRTIGSIIHIAGWEVRDLQLHEPRGELIEHS